MREIRMSGLTRGEAAAVLPLSYSTSIVARLFEAGLFSRNPGSLFEPEPQSRRQTPATEYFNSLLGLGAATSSIT
jgi:hypothetical protein